MHPQVLAWICWSSSDSQQNLKYGLIMFIAARDWNFEFDVAFEGRNHSAHLVKPSAMLRNIRVQIPRHPSLLDRRGSSFCMSFFSSFAMHVRQVNFKYAYMKLTGSVYLLCAKLVPQIITINMWVHWMLSTNRDYPRSVKEIFASGVCLLRFLLLKMETWYAFLGACILSQLFSS